MEEPIGGAPECGEASSDAASSVCEPNPRDEFRVSLKDLFNGVISRERVNATKRLFVELEHRHSFLIELGLRRAQPPGVAMRSESFLELCGLLECLLVFAERDNDFKSFKLSIHLASTFYRCVPHGDGEEFFDYITHHIAHCDKISIWQSKTFWSEIYYDEVLSEQQKHAEIFSSRLPWKDADLSKKQDVIIHEQNVYFSTLGTFTHLMLTFGVTPVETRLFIRKQCFINNLSREHSALLLENLSNVANHVVQYEEQRRVVFSHGGGKESACAPPLHHSSGAALRTKASNIGKVSNIRHHIRKRQVRRQGKKMEHKLEKEFVHGKDGATATKGEHQRRRRTTMAKTLRCSSRNSRIRTSLGGGRRDVLPEAKGEWELEVDVSPQLIRVQSDPAIVGASSSLGETFTIGSTARVVESSDGGDVHSLGSGGKSRGILSLMLGRDGGDDCRQDEGDCEVMCTMQRCNSTDDGGAERDAAGIPPALPKKSSKPTLKPKQAYSRKET